jgi:hypothetical protein
MSPATAAPAMSAFDVFIWFLVFLLLSFSPVAVIDHEMLKIGSMCVQKCFNEDYASPY